MSIAIFVTICVVVAFITLAIEAGVQDRIRHKDMTWFSWLGRHIKDAMPSKTDETATARKVASTK